MAGLAGLGLVFAVLATVVMSGHAIDDFKYVFVRPPIGHFDQFWQHLVWLWCLAGLILASIGGLIGRPRYFWPLFMALGAVYAISSCIVMLAENRYGSPSRIALMTLWITSPGIVFIIEGLIIRYLRRRSQMVNVNFSPST